MSAEENKSIIRRVFEEAINGGDVALIDEFWAEGFVDHCAWPGQAPGAAGTKQAIVDFLAAFPDLHVEIEDMIAEGDKVATRERWSGTHATSGMQVAGTTMHVFRIRNGRVVDEWSKGWDWVEGLG